MVFWCCSLVNGSTDAAACSWLDVAVAVAPGCGCERAIGWLFLKSGSTRTGWAFVKTGVARVQLAQRVDYPCRCLRMEVSWGEPWVDDDTSETCSHFPPSSPLLFCPRPVPSRRRRIGHGPDPTAAARRVPSNARTVARKGVRPRPTFAVACTAANRWPCPVLPCTRRRRAFSALLVAAGVRVPTCEPVSDEKEDDRSSKKKRKKTTCY